jgi:Uma2 family endonuclease
VATSLSDRTLAGCFGDGFWVRVKMSLDLEPDSAPEPDLAVIQGLPQDCPSKPSWALLVVEIIESARNHDRSTKQRLYASNNIADYWIINLDDRQLEIHRNPAADRYETYTHRYKDVRILTLDEAVTPLALPAISIPVSRLFPPNRNAP